MTAIAVVGIGCKFPGGIDDADSFWDFVLNKGDAVTDIPKDRWDADKFYDPDPEAPGRMYTRAASFLTHRFQSFDADFFGISRKEAAILDPQQRLLLEVTWEALDDAGIAGKVAGTDVGVFMGGFTNDNAVSRGITNKLEKINNFAAFSASQTLLSNRVSYTLNLTGPSMTVDTACSSSLVATHLAVQAITSGECDVALAGGSSIIFQPETFITMCKGRFLAVDGRCKSFDAAADGYGRGEGIGVVVLKSLEQARRDGDRVYAVLRGSGVNQDGRTMALPVPNPTSQRQLAERVLREAEVDPALVGFVEAHGTGTGIGDPLELSALGNAYGLAEGRTEPLLIGSVKNNFGHTEAAAGVAGLIKAALTVQRRTIAPQAVFNAPHPDVSLDSLRVRIPTEAEPYPDLGGPALVAVNSFGYGGTNAHVILEEPPAPTENQSPTRDSVRVFPISARSGSSLHDTARDYAELLRSDPTEENAQRLKTGVVGRRAQHFLRRGFIYRDAGDLLEQLSAYAQSDEPAPPRVLFGGITDPVFVFSGMGPQWWGMGRSLLARPGLFFDIAQDIDVAFGQVSGWSLMAELLRTEESSRVTRTRIAQPANFMIQAALVKYLEQFGIRPTAVVGHSVGEVTSAYVSGALSLADAAKVSFHRARVQAKTEGTGGMLAVGLGEQDAERRIERFEGAVSIAAINGRGAVTLAGDSGALSALHDELVAEEVFAKALRVDVPYHSHLMDPILDELAGALTGLVPRQANIPLYSTVTGGQVDGKEFADPAYWQKNVRQPVLFADAVDKLISDRHWVFLEVGPHPVLTGNIREGFVHNNIFGAAVSTLHRDRDAEEAVLQAVSDLYAVGSIDVPGEVDLYRNGTVEHMDLPKYPWVREEIWEEDPSTLSSRYGDSDRFALLGDRTGELPPTWGLTLAPANLPWLPDHVVAGTVVLPGTAYLDAALSAVRQRTGHTYAGLDAVAFTTALIVGDQDVPITRFVVDRSTNRFSFNGRSSHTELWTEHAHGRLVEASLGSMKVDIPAASENDEVFESEAIYERLRAAALSYGPAFQRIRSARVTGSTCVAQLESPDLSETGPASPYSVHPTISDAALQCIAVVLAARPELLAVQTAHIPVAVERVRLYHEVPENPLAVVEVTGSRPLRANAYLVSPDGDVALAMMGVLLQPVGPAPDPLEELDQHFYELKWELADPEPEQPQAEAEQVEGQEAEQPHVEGQQAEDQQAEGQEPEQAPRLDQAARAEQLIERRLAERRQAEQPKVDGQQPVVLEVQEANAVVEVGDVSASVAEGVRRTASGEASVIRLAAGASQDQSAELLEALGSVLSRDSFLRVVVAFGTTNTAEENLYQLLAVTKALTTINPDKEEPDAAASEEQAAALEEQPVAPEMQLVMVTSKALVAPGDSDLDLAQAPLVGARRTLANEKESVQWFLVDLPGSATADEVAAEVGAAGTRIDLDEVAVRGGRRWTQRLRRSLSDLTAVWDQPVQSTDPDVAYEIQMPKSRLFKDLALRECDRVEPGSRQAEVSFQSMGLNFKDALKVVGILGERELEGTFFGTKPVMETTGVITRVGPHVDELVVGDLVVVADRSTPLRRYVTFELDGDTPWARLEEDKLHYVNSDPLTIGSGLPYIAAVHAFRNLARLQPGEKVLVHGAAGGTGMGAVQVALRMGAVVYATAGSEERRQAALDLGATAAFDSRSVSFVDDILRVTNGEGVDVIYNSLPGEVLTQNFEVAGEFCRIVEIGKADILFGGAVELKPFNKNLAFYSVDMDRLMLRRPQEFRELLRESVALFAVAGEERFFKLLPYTRFPVAEVVQAFEAVFKAAHMGRIVIDLRDQLPMVLPRKPQPTPMRADGSYLITGGFGAFGLATAGSLAKKGATHLVLVGRSGAATDEARTQIEALRAKGVHVQEEQLDITDYEQVRDLVGRLESSEHPLRGVFHAAGVVNDQPFGEITLDALREVLAPKVTGATNLDKATREHDSQLDMFVLYSSISALVGIVPQVSYVSANSALDAFAEWRHSLGLPATSINWGAMSGGGMAETSDAVITYLDYLGMKFIDMDAGVELMRESSRFGLPHVSLVSADWERLQTTMPVAFQSSRLAHLPKESASMSDEQAEFRAMLLQLQPEERGPAVTQVLVEQLAEVLEVEPATLDPRAPIVDLGIDSLMAVEFGARAAKRLNIQVGALQFTPDLTLERVGNRVSDLLIQTANVEDAAERDASKRALQKPHPPQQNAAKDDAVEAVENGSAGHNAGNGSAEHNAEERDAVRM
ncbi:MAG: SDR family NAD(P)-dependent oxidoreductase [Segniliparus sp.]|uniref:SDR family NAD(P)-dependent oxidoreductase n=1 Tax=Segniliparus sp. TaxID=2804064 RepID=UPI003F2EB7E6